MSFPTPLIFRYHLPLIHSYTYNPHAKSSPFLNFQFFRTTHRYGQFFKSMVVKTVYLSIGWPKCTNFAVSIRCTKNLPPVSFFEKQQKKVRYRYSQQITITKSFRDIATPAAWVSKSQHASEKMSNAPL
jgi:hypothetical protein